MDRKMRARRNNAEAKRQREGSDRGRSKPRSIALLVPRDLDVTVCNVATGEEVEPVAVVPVELPTEH